MILITREKLGTVKDLLLDFNAELSASMGEMTCREEAESTQAKLGNMQTMIEVIDKLLAADCPLGVREENAHSGNALCDDCDRRDECLIWVPF